MSDDLVKMARNAAAEIANAGHAGWGNVLIDCADALEQLQRELEHTQADRDVFDSGMKLNHAAMMKAEADLARLTPTEKEKTKALKIVQAIGDDAEGPWWIDIAALLRKFVLREAE